jgi:steroid delta-isomerase
MTRNSSLLLLILGHSFMVSAQHLGKKSLPPVDEATRIKNTISKIREHYNNNTPDSILRFYARDLLVSYPGMPDTDYLGFQQAYNEMKAATGVHTVTRDSIEEIIVSGDMAMVRFSWLTTQTRENPAKTVRWRARDFTIWRKEPDGEWRFSRGMWFREKPLEIR